MDSPPRAPPVKYKAPLGTRWEKEKAAAGSGDGEERKRVLEHGRYGAGVIRGKGGRENVCSGRGAGGCRRKEGRSGDARVGFIGLPGTLGLGFDVGGFSTLRVIASAVN